MRFFFLFLSIIICCCRCYTQTADYIFFGGDILTMDKQNPQVETVAVAEGKIIFVGEKKKALFLQSDQTRWINLQKGALLPGFISLSSHLLLNGLTKFTLDLSSENIKTFSQVEDILKEAVRHGPVLAMGYDPSNLSKKQKLGFKKLEKISQTQPILVINKSGTMAYGNKKAFELAGIDETLDGGTTPFFQKNKKGFLTGVALSPEASFMLLKPFESLLKLDLKKILKNSMQDFAKKGFTTVIDDGFGNALISLSSYLKTLDDISSSSLFVKVKGFAPYSQMEMAKDLKKTSRSFFELLGIQIYIDGSIQNYQAAMKQHYKGKKTRGIEFISKFELTEQMVKSRKEGFLVKIKASGDAAIENVLSCCEKTQMHTIGPKTSFILEQPSLLSASDLKTLEQAHICPSFSYQDIYLWGDVLKEKILGALGISHLDSIKSCLHLGLATSLQEGAALGGVDPMLCLQTFITRYSKNKAILNQEEKISVDQALQGLTLDPSRQLNLDESIGSIEVGKHADFVILNKNPKRVPVTQFSTIKVIETWIDGKKVALFE